MNKYIHYQNIHNNIKLVNKHLKFQVYQIIYYLLVHFIYILLIFNNIMNI